MAVSMADARIIGGDQDPQVPVATPGCVLRFRPERTPITPAATRGYLVRSSQEDMRLDQRIPPVWVQAAVDTYVTRITTGAVAGVTSGRQLALSTTAADPNDGVPPGAVVAGQNLTQAAIDNWGLVAFDGRGGAIYTNLASFADTTEPYTGPGPWTGLSSIVSATSRDWTVLIVDRSHPNVDWDDLEFVSVRAGAGFDLGNDRMLRALTRGTLYWTLHSGTPPTAANRITGGGYQDVAITGPAGWELSSDEADRVIQPGAEANFGMATNTWTRASHIALWTGAAATGTLRWYDSIRDGAFTPRVGARPRIPIRGLKIAFPNVV